MLFLTQNRFTIRSDALHILHMIKSVIAILIALSCLWAAPGQHALAEESGSSSFSLLLRAANTRIKAGTVPSFTLTILNQSAKPEKILDISNGRRNDLQHTYYDLEILREGKRVDLPRAISDPGPISEKDFLVLHPDQKVTFDLRSFPILFEKLPPGNYTARVRFWQNPYDLATRSYSSEAEFTVYR